MRAEMIFVCTGCKRDVESQGNFCPYCGTVAPPPSSQKADPLIGQTIAKKYFVNQPVGSGGMGTVYKATDLVLDRAVALKMLSKSLAADPQMVQRFHREARAASRLNHPNAITVLDFGQTDDGALFIAMEYLAGRSLSELIQKEFPLEPDRVIRLVAQILSALVDAHGLGIIHRDLKPSNVMVDARHEEEFVTVLDFGIAKLNDPGDGAAKLTTFGMVCGTPGYMSPEQARGESLDPRSDLYSVGVILYELLTGKVPFDDATPIGIITRQMTEVPPSPRSIRPDISPELDALVARATAKERDERPKSAQEFRAELLACEIGRPGARSTPVPARSATVVLPAVDDRGTPQPRMAAKRATGPALPSESVHVDPTLNPPTVAQRGATPIAGVAPRASTPAPAQPPEDPHRGPERNERAATETPPPTPRPTPPRERRATPRDVASPNRGLIIGGGVGAVVILGALGFLLTRDPFAVEPPPPPAAAPTATLKLEPKEALRPEPTPEPAPTPDPSEPSEPVAANDDPPAEPAADGAASQEQREPDPEPADATARGEVRPAAAVREKPRPRAVRRPAKPGLVEFRVRPYAIVYIDGKKAGTTPFAPLELPPGRHQIRLENPDLKQTHADKVEVKSGEKVVFKHVFE